VDNVALRFLPTVALTGLTSVANVTTAATTTWNTSNPDGSAPTINAAAAGTLVEFYDTGDINYGADVVGGDGPNKWFKVVLPSAGTRAYTLDWNSTADLDLMLTDAAITTAYVSRLTSAHPETGSTNQPAGNYWMVGIFYSGTGPGIV